MHGVGHYKKVELSPIHGGPYSLPLNYFPDVPYMPAGNVLLSICEIHIARAIKYMEVSAHAS